MRGARSCRRLLLLAVLVVLLRGCSGQAQAGEDGGAGADSPESAAAGAPSPMEEKERAALYAAIESFVGNGWNGSALYPDPCGWSPIQGVSCDLFNGLWYPTSISIGPVLDNSLQCSPDARFSPQLFDLRRLRTLSFYSCFPATNPTAIPAATSWEKLSGTLETLEFRTNPGLTGAIPASLGRLASLQSLVIVENNLTGGVPAELGGLLKLRRLVLSGNGLSGPIPPTLGGLRGLLKMDLSNNVLQGSIPPELAGLRNLTLLDLRNNSLTGGVPNFIHAMASLQDLLLSNNPLGGILPPSGWEKMSPTLATLDLSNTGVSGTIPESMAALRGLRFMALDHNHLTGAVPAALARMPSIGAMYLNGNNLTGELGFEAAFYERMGRRFASWDNPGLCYDVAAVDAAHAPAGVVVCKDMQEPGGQEEHGGRKPEASSSLMASSSAAYGLGLSAVRAGGFWWSLMVASGTVAAVLGSVLL